MSHATKTGKIEVRHHTLSQKNVQQKLAIPLELPAKHNQWNVCFLRADLLVRNFAIVGVMLLTVLALKNSPTPEAQSVFAVLKDSAGLEWDESIGKLSFVNSFLPDRIQAVWNSSGKRMVHRPVNGETLHAWSRLEPYVELSSISSAVYAAADGEVMSIAHGMEEERILRIRHDNETETVYGNLKSCMVREGERVRAGEKIGEVLDKQNLVFELRVSGQSIDPSNSWIHEE